MNKKIYVVYGSEDGILGTCSNMKNAYKVASNYFHDEDVKLKFHHSLSLKISFSSSGVSKLNPFPSLRMTPISMLV